MSNKNDLSSIKGVDLSEDDLDGTTGGAGGYKPADAPINKGDDAGAQIARPAKTKEGYSIGKLIFYK